MIGGGCGVLGFLWGWRYGVGIGLRREGWWCNGCSGGGHRDSNFKVDGGVIGEFVLKRKLRNP